MQPEDWKNLFLSVVASAIFATFQLLIAYLGKRFLHTLLPKTDLRFRIALSQLLLGATALLAATVWNDQVLLIAIYLLVSILSVFWQTSALTALGIADVHTTTTEGIDYDASLRMARTSIEFLGVGAHKLTMSGEFVAALDRCATNSRVVKLLLSPPSNAALEGIARRNNKPESAYQSRVEESLRRIAELARDRRWNVEVRTYSGRAVLPQFRLMFIDDQTCLFSYMVWSEKEGRDNPQLVLRKQDRSAERSIYRAMREYFEDLWQEAQPVSLADYLR